MKFHHFLCRNPNPLFPAEMSSDMLEDDEHAVSTVVDNNNQFDNDNDNNNDIDDDNVVIDAADLDANDVAALVAANEERNNS